MVAKLIAFASVAGSFAADTDPAIQIALGPGAKPAFASVLSHLNARRQQTQSAALKEVDGSMNAALAKATLKINEVLKSSFLTSSDNEVLVKVASTPSDSAAAFENFAVFRDENENKEVELAKKSFDAIADVVVEELKKTVGKTSFINLKVAASEIPFTSATQLFKLEATKEAASQKSFGDALIEKQISFVNALNKIIDAAASKASFLKAPSMKDLITLGEAEVAEAKAFLAASKASFLKTMPAAAATAATKIADILKSATDSAEYQSVESADVESTIASIKERLMEEASEEMAQDAARMNAYEEAHGALSKYTGA